MDVVNPQFRFLSKELVEEWDGVDLGINTWVLNTKKAMCQAIQWEVDGISIDNPQLLQMILCEEKIQL